MKLNTLMAGLLIGSTPLWAGLCADVGTSAYFDLVEVEESIWNEADIQNLGTPDVNQVLTDPTQITVVESSLSYQIPTRFSASCDWIQSGTETLINLGTQNLTPSSMTQFIKIRDAQAVDVDNDGNVTVGANIDYWIQIGDSPQDTVSDGLVFLDSSTVSIQGDYYITDTSGQFSYWIATNYISNGSGASSKLEDSFLTRNNPDSATVAMQRAFSDTTLKFPDFKSEFQLLKLTFAQSDDQTVGIQSQSPIAQFTLEDNLIQWNETQEWVRVVNPQGQIVLSQTRSNTTSFELLPKGTYWVQSSQQASFKIHKF